MPIHNNSSLHKMVAIMLVGMPAVSHSMLSYLTAPQFTNKFVKPMCMMYSKTYKPTI